MSKLWCFIGRPENILGALAACDAAGGGFFAAMAHARNMMNKPHRLDSHPRR